jgi:hypothetical protein
MPAIAAAIPTAITLLNSFAGAAAAAGPAMDAAANLKQSFAKTGGPKATAEAGQMPSRSALPGAEAKPSSAEAKPSGAEAKPSGSLMSALQQNLGISGKLGAPEEGAPKAGSILGQAGEQMKSMLGIRG